MASQTLARFLGVVLLVYPLGGFQRPPRESWNFLLENTANEKGQTIFEGISFSFFAPPGTTCRDAKDFEDEACIGSVKITAILVTGDNDAELVKVTRTVPMKGNIENEIAKLPIKIGDPRKCVVRRLEIEIGGFHSAVDSPERNNWYPLLVRETSALR